MTLNHRIANEIKFMGIEAEKMLRKIGFTFDYETLNYTYFNKKLVAEAKIEGPNLKIFYIPMSLTLKDEEVTYKLMDINDVHTKIQKKMEELKCQTS